MKYRIISHDQGSLEWLAFRSNKIGASDIPTICNVAGSYNTRSKLLAEKTGGAPKEHSEYTKELFASGHEWEIKVRDSINKELGLNFKPIVLQHENIDEFFASLDGLSEDKTTSLEVKSTKKKDYLDLVSRCICPLVWQYQIQWQMYISGTFKSILAVVNSDTGAITVTEHLRDDELLEFIIDHANHFLKDMQTPTDIKHTITLDQDESMKYIADSKRAIKEYQKLIDEEEDKIKKMSEDLLKDFESNKIEAHGISVEWQERKGAIDYAKIKELEGVNLEKYRKKSTRYIRIVEVKERKQIGETTHENLSINS